jgi:hypothetical protein
MVAINFFILDVLMLWCARLQVWSLGSKGTWNKRKRAMNGFGGFVMYSDVRLYDWSNSVRKRS